MLNKTFTYLPNITAKRFALALLASILLHFALIQGVNLSLLPEETTPHLIEVSLSATPKPAVKAPEPTKPPASKAKTSIKEPKINKSPIEHPVTETKVEPEQTSQTEPSIAPVQEAAPPSADGDPVTGEPIQTEPLGGSAPENSFEPIETTTADYTPPYHQFIMQFDVTTGEDKGQIGSAQIEYNTTSDNTYTITSILEPNFIASLIIKGALIQTSQGSYSEQGLKPKHYEYAFAKKADKTYSADFDWDNNKLTMHTSKGDAQTDLSPAAQDLLSFMFQFMFIPPLQEMNLAITTGRKFRTYNYSFEGEESIKTKLGDIKTLHIKNVRGEEQEKTELWLAVDYRNIPVKIRKTEKDGKVIEQTITNLAIERP